MVILVVFQNGNLKDCVRNEEVIEPSTASNNSLAPELSYFDNKVRVKFDRSSLKEDKMTFTHAINLWNYVDSSDPALGNYLFGAVKIVKNSDIDKYKYS